MGGGLERITAASNDHPDVFKIDSFSRIIEKIRSFPTKLDDRSERIIADHIRAATFLIGDGVIPSNTDRGYILRRLLRRAYTKNKDVYLVIDAVVNHSSYKDLYTFAPNIKEVVAQELEKFGKTLDAGLKQIKKGEDPFTLFTSYGLPLEIIKEVVPNIDEAKFQKQMEEHKQISSIAGEQKFKK